VALATTPEREQELSANLGPIITDTNKRAALAKQLLQRLREDCDGIKSSPSTSQKEANELRIRENLINTLTRKFVDVMKSYQNAQQKFKLDIKKKMKRQIQIVKPDATPEEIDEVIISGGGAGEIFKNVILKGTPSDSVRNATRNVQDKYQDVMRLEASVAQLHEMFVDFAQLTEQQGELLDQIEFQ
ncbi:Stx3, partial [Symbiodinium microadriaticum]